MNEEFEEVTCEQPARKKENTVSITNRIINLEGLILSTQ